MIKLILLPVVVLGSFAGTVALAMLLTGSLNQESIERLMGTETELAAPPETASQNLSGLAEQLKAKSDELAKLEQTLKEREAQLNKREQELATLRTEVEAIQKQISGSLEDENADRSVRLKTVALSVSAMKPDKAAEILGNYPPEDAAEILQEIPDKNRGKILEGMTPEFATKVLQSMRESMM
ncbi:MAG: hypothetical protein HYV27_03335 [Candidatus Hydrogenedentes bacterium]|nr:hypothetical protein [Candidatus Hydrogenedentota bacterium]